MKSHLHRLILKQNHPPPVFKLKKKSTLSSDENPSSFSLTL